MAMSIHNYVLICYLKGLVLKLFITILTMIIINFVASADQKSNYFAKNCLKHLYQTKNQDKDKIVSGSITHFKLTDLNEKRKKQPKGFGPHNCYTDNLKFEHVKQQCNASYGMCLYFDVRKPWNEITKEYIACYMDNNGEVLVAVQLRNKWNLKKCLFY